jgi:hypothetical protein
MGHVLSILIFFQYFLGHKWTDIQEYPSEDVLFVIINKIWVYSNLSSQIPFSDDCVLHLYPLYDQ